MIKSYYCVHNTDYTAISFYRNAREALIALLIAVHEDEKYDWVPECIHELVDESIIEYANRIDAQNAASFISKISKERLKLMEEILHSKYEEFFGRVIQFDGEKELEEFIAEKQDLFGCCVSGIFTTDPKWKDNTNRIVSFLFGLSKDEVDVVTYAAVKNATQKYKSYGDLEEEISIIAQRFGYSFDELFDLTIAIILKEVL